MRFYIVQFLPNLTKQLFVCYNIYIGYPSTLLIEYNFRNILENYFRQILDKKINLKGVDSEMFFTFNEELKADYRNEDVILYNRNCLEVLEKLPNNSIDLVVTDCPYRVSTSGKPSKNSKKLCGGILSQTNELAKNGKLFTHNDIKFSEWLPLVYNKLKDNTHCYIFINGRNLAELQREAEKVGFKYQQLLVWDKGNATPCHYYMNAVEYILMLRKGNARDIKNMGTKNILRIHNIMGNKLHPTEKPSSLMGILITNSSNKDDVVLDPFMGSGSCGVACAETGRRFIGCEIDKKYFDVTVDRMESLKDKGVMK